MTVPKKLISKSKKNARKANWKRKGYHIRRKFLYKVYLLTMNKFKNLFLKFIILW